jgi:hypothetical protein
MSSLSGNLQPNEVKKAEHYRDAMAIWASAFHNGSITIILQGSSVFFKFIFSQGQDE